MSRFRIVTFFCVAGFVMGCGNLRELPTAPGDPDPIDQSATFARVQSEVLTPSCTFIGCHDALGHSQELILVQGQAYSNLVGRPSTEISQLNRVQPGDPDMSYLWWKVTGRSGMTGERMPAGLPSLSPAKLDLVRNWIRRGAPND